MQMVVKGSKEKVKIYQKAFNAEVLCAYGDRNGGYIHLEISAYDQGDCYI